MSGAAMVTAAVLILLAPFGEGGRLPDVLACLHLLTLMLVGLAALKVVASATRGRPRGRGVGVLLLPAAFLALALVSAPGAGYPYAALLALMDGFAAVGAACAAAVLLARPRDMVRLRVLVVASTTLQALLALHALATGGLEAAARAFLNRNHLAAFLDVGLVLSVAAADAAMARGERRVAVAWAAVATLHVGAIVPLQSRGAILGLAAAAAAFLLVRWHAWSRRARVVAAITCAAALLAGLGFVALRFARNDDPDRYTRLRIWEASLGMVRAHPLLGLGPGMFAHEAPRHNFAVDRGPVRYGRQFQGAHSAALTIAAENGLPALLILGAAALAWTRVLLRRREADPAASAALGAGLALVALLAQALVEDLQQRPAIVLTAALLAGTAIASSRGWRSGPRSRRPDIGWRPLTASALAALAIWTAAGGVIDPWLAWRCARQARLSGREGLPLMERAARLDPWNAEYHLDLAMAALNAGPPDPVSYARAANELDRARACDRQDARLALLRARLEARAGGAILRDPSASARAAALYDEAAALAPMDPRPRLEQAGQLADAGDLERALAAAGAALSIEPHYRRARLLQIHLLERLGRDEESGRALEALRASDTVLAGYLPDSGYAQEIVADDPASRRSLEGMQGPASEAPAQAATR